MTSFDTPLDLVENVADGSLLRDRSWRAKDHAVAACPDRTLRPARQPMAALPEPRKRNVGLAALRNHRYDGAS